mmetsp:Transcript_1244/g.2251  ORF Transcript_1244/g.2251 Transcript_1244/m.2251 type:complete len:128 (-) Transcript_1244:4617-5000(-)
MDDVPTTWGESYNPRRDFIRNDRGYRDEEGFRDVDRRRRGGLALRRGGDVNDSLGPVSSARNHDPRSLDQDEWYPVQSCQEVCVCVCVCVFACVFACCVRAKCVKIEYITYSIDCMLLLYICIYYCQ